MCNCKFVKFKCAGVQASVALNAMGAGLVELYSAKERGITRPVKKLIRND